MDKIRRAILIFALLSLQVNALSAFADKVIFPHAFAPQDGLVSPYEEPMRQELCLNGSWQFQGTDDITVPGADVPALGDWDPVADRKSTRLNSSHSRRSRMPSSA